MRRRRADAITAAAITTAEPARCAMLTEAVLKRYLKDLPSGHIFDLPYSQFAEIFPPGQPDNDAREKLRLLAAECACDIAHMADEQRYELIRR